MNKIKTTFIIIAFIASAGIVSTAFAHGGWGGGAYGGHMMGPGYGGGDMMGPGYGGGHMMGYGPGYGPYMRGYGSWGSLSEEDAVKIDAARDDFYKETRELRGKIDDARIALHSEMDKNQPNESKVMELQKQLSKMQAQFDQKALAHELKIDKMVPGGHQVRRFRGGYCW